MLNIGDIAQIDEQAEFRSDVQLSAFDDPKMNIALLRSYMFSSTARKDERSATPSKSPADILELLIQVYSNQRMDNRLVVIANYGHGKSHLALALANYFGKPIDSPELKITLDKLKYAINIPTKVERYKTFKEGRGRFLIIRLRGDVRRSLRRQFVLGLEQALNEHPETKGTQLPFWFGQAEKFLQDLNGGYRQQADDYLSQYQTDVPLLLQDVRDRKESAHQRCIDLIKHLHGVTADLGSDIALKDATSWITKQFCGPGKPFGGVLVLFDEFSLYVLNYAHRSAPGELQDLLNGVDDNRGQVVFLAFAQHDPIQVAREAYQRGQLSQTQQESLERELTRLQKKFTLYSVLESVIDSYLIQPEEVWKKFSQEIRVRGSLYRATDVTLETFRKRYEDDLNWTTEHVQETMTKGCFPLHPLTTALLCNLQFQEDAAHLGTARTVLGFVRGELESRLDLPAVEGGVNANINWALPVGLVDYYGEALSPTLYQQYLNARRTIGEELTAEQEAALKALLLQEVAALPNRGGQQAELLSEMAGLKSTDLKKALKELSKAQAILLNTYQGKYTFWSIGNDPHKLDRILGQYFKGQSVDWSLLSQASRDDLESVKIRIDWGHPQDWQAAAYFLTKRFFTVTRLRKLCPVFTHDPRKGILEGERGCILWLIGQNQDEIEWFKEKAAQVLDQAFPGQSPLPIVAVVPEQPSSELLDAWLRKRGLESFEQDERKEVGLELHSAQLLRTTTAIGEELQRLKIGGKFERLPRPSYRYLAPLAYRTAVRGVTKTSLYQVVEKSYFLAYQAAPPEFFTQYKLNSTHLKSAVKHLANLLRQNSKIDPQRLPQGIARDLGQKILRDKWLLLTTTGYVHEPGNARIRQVWDVLEKSFVAGKETPVRDALVPLFNTPYGYDYHTATLVFCAWFGCHKYDVQLTAKGRRASGEKLDEWLKKDSKNFINLICHAENATLQRRDRHEEEKTAREYIKKAGQTMSQTEAWIVKEWLEVYGQSGVGNQTLQVQVVQAAERLQSALTAAEEYDRAARDIDQNIKNKQKSLMALISQQSKISALPAIDNVRHTEASAKVLRKDWLESVQQAVNRKCTELENLTSLTQLELHRQKLRDLKGQLKGAKLTGSMVERVEAALVVIDQKATDLRILEQEDGIRNSINEMERSASLLVLRGCQERLRQMQDYSTQTLQLRDKKLQGIEKEIDQLEKLGHELAEAVDRLDSSQAVRKWNNRYLRVQVRYNGTPYSESLALAEQQVAVLRTFFKELESVQAESFKTREEAAKIQVRLAKLKEQNADRLSAEQIALIKKADNDFIRRVKSKINQADRWLDSLEKVWQEGATPVTMHLKLYPAPPFLKSESKSKLDQLVKSVQQKLDEDSISAIEIKFRQIADAARRQQCLERLSQVNKELGGKVS